MTQDASSNKIDSHIQMPKCILKRFENPHFNSFYSYDVRGDFIKKEWARQLYKYRTRILFYHCRTTS